MEREIKFRAWDNVDYMSTPFTLYDVWDRKVEFTTDAIIMRFTGLKDKNGKEIYEGDVVTGTCSTNKLYVCAGLQLTESMGKAVTGIIKYSALYAQFYFTTDEITYLDLCMGLRDIQVIGNIYENKTER